MHGEKRSQIDFSRDGLARFDVKGRLRSVLFERREEPAFARIDFEAEPVLAIFIVEIDVASGEIRDLEGGQDRLVRDVLEPLKFQLHLDLGLRRGGEKTRSERTEDPFHPEPE